ncbi:unnamed protein product [Bursaphelenchus xylophilus]|uniref:(pine wood nematode) hypothetical protein n=1 Tax=Bursaphelenchus xylophilus TaxID=6326 RepID=A0A1I7SDC4_BURXY|nr:unnamed protein product [Bursaphelenchus xylophilus]CAG9130595.1 unnamed protein product [Bursaphelenchus xylophilus]
MNLAPLGLFWLFLIIPRIRADDKKLCVSNVCFNGGICVVERGINEDNPTFQCECLPGFTGTLCEEQLQCNLKCKNKGLCRFHNGSSEPFCECPEGFAGLLCDKEVDCQHSGCPEDQICLLDLNLNKFSCEVDICQSQNPCHHNATCRPIKDDFICECTKGLRGRLCDEDVNECEEELMPCLNHGECENILGGFNCKCPIGFEGKICEQRVGQCVQKPCVHGRCVDTIDGFRCDCNTGFEGKLCNKEECTVNGRSCLNGGECVKESNVTRCNCPQSFQGKWCDRLQLATDEESITTATQIADEVNSSTVNSSCNCLNGGVCLSDDACQCPHNFVGPLCQTECNCSSSELCNQGPSTGSFKCISTQSSTDHVSTGLLLPGIDHNTVAVQPTTNISSCEECSNSEKCVMTNNQHLCLCSVGFQGPLCTERSHICEGVSCQEGQICRLRRTSKNDVPFCSCPPGLSGEGCNQRTPEASFNESSVVIIQVLADHKLDTHWIQFRFRTTVPNVHFLTGESILNDFSYSLGLSDGFPYFALKDQKKETVKETRVNDGDWYQITLAGSVNGTVIEVSHFETGYVLGHRQLAANNFDIFSIRIGRVDKGHHMIGCMGNIMVDGNPIDIFSKQRSIDVRRGCEREVQCRPETCSHGGYCLDYWSYHKCECRRPFLQPDCLHKLSESTFGHENETSLAEYAGDKNNLGELTKETEISFIIRTNRDLGQVFYLGQTSDDDTTTFLNGRLSNGTVKVDVRLGGRKVYSIKGNTIVNDNEPHVVTVGRNGNQIDLFVDGKLDESLKIDRPFEHPLLIDRLVLGGNSTQIGETEEKEIFKGTLQDVRINGNPLILSKRQPDFIKDPLFLTLIDAQNLLEGTVSDEICMKLTPCVHGECTDTFNDYECKCEPGYMGKNCDLKDYCSAQPCPLNAQCINTHGGYVCKSPSTFATTSVAEFTLVGNLSTAEDIFDISFSLRTRSEKSRILTISLNETLLWMNLRGKSVQFGITSSNGTLNDTIKTDVIDGQWHSINIFAKNNQLYVNFDNMSSLKVFNGYNWTRTMTQDLQKIAFGKYLNESGFKGCLHNVKISEYPSLSFFGLEGFGFLDGPHFVSSRLINLRPDGCHSKSLCGTDGNPCKNGGLCKDLFNAINCECVKGFQGRFCEININECSENISCGEHGVCVDDIGSYRCDCKKGYAGPKCDQKVDFCIENPCRNGGECENIEHGYQCKCSEAYMGMNCTVKRDTHCIQRPCANEASCKDSEMGPTCECQKGFSGDLCEVTPGDMDCLEMPCKNGGRCKTTYKNTTAYFCDCPKGFEGQNCDQPKDYCHSAPCKNGECHNVFNDYICECNSGWEGMKCDRDVNECLEDFPCENNGTCVNTKGAFSCICPEFYFGERCEIAGICTTSPCKNGKCTQNGQNNYTCECKNGYEGVNCDVEIDYCKQHPCLNGGTCNRKVGGYTCTCIPGFMGEKCETDIDDCAGGNKCANGGKCIDRVNGFECNCRETGYKGTQCQEDINECDEEGLNCVNGHCENLPGSYYCHCKDNFIGSKCNMINPCSMSSSNKTLHNCVHGDCINPRVIKNASGRELSQYDCKCHEGYTGSQCVQMVEKQRSVSLGYIIGPSVVLLIVCAVLVCMLFFFVAKNRRANQGTYSPSNQEVTGARVQMHTIQKPIKKQERLI